MKGKNIGKGIAALAATLALAAGTNSVINYGKRPGVQRQLEIKGERRSHEENVRSLEYQAEYNMGSAFQARVAGDKQQWNDYLEKAKRHYRAAIDLSAQSSYSTKDEAKRLERSLRSLNDWR